MTLTATQFSLIPFGLAALTAYVLFRGLGRGMFRVKGLTIERGDSSLYWVYACFLCAMVGAFVFFGCKSLYIAWMIR